MLFQYTGNKLKKLKKDKTVPMPECFGAYIRKILNGIPLELNTSAQTIANSPTLNSTDHKEEALLKTSVLSEQKKFEGGIGKFLRGGKKFPNNTKNTSKISPSTSKINDWSLTFSTDQKKYLNFLLKIIPEKGNQITKNAATWWIKHYGIEKTKTALQVYWQQVERAKKTPNVPMPNSIGAYVRTALNEGTKPCQEQDKRNKAFAEKFKATHSWCELTITEKYCRMEGVGKEWYYFLPEEMFRESLLNAYSNFGEIQNRWVI